MAIDVLGLTRLGVNSDCTPVSRTSTGKTRSAAAAAIRRPTCLQYCAVRRPHRSPLGSKPRALLGPFLRSLRTYSQPRRLPLSLVTLTDPQTLPWTVLNQLTLQLSSVSSLMRQTRPANLTQHRRGLLSGLLVSYRRSSQHCSTRLSVTVFFPSTQKCAVVTPVLKKSLEPFDTTNYRPISNLTFISKMLERCACDQRNAHLQRHGLIPEP